MAVFRYFKHLFIDMLIITVFRYLKHLFIERRPVQIDLYVSWKFLVLPVYILLGVSFGWIQYNI